MNKKEGRSGLCPRSHPPPAAGPDIEIVDLDGPESGVGAKVGFASGGEIADFANPLMPWFQLMPQGEKLANRKAALESLDATDTIEPPE